LLAKRAKAARGPFTLIEMSGHPETKPDGIELHFCRDCGISIPIPDIESGAANPALPGCAYGEEHCVNRSDAPVPDAPAPTRASALAGSATSSPSRDNGMRLVAGLALLYVVGTSTFLLFREINRPPTEVVLPTDVALVRDIRGLGHKVDAIDKQARTALGQLKENDSVQAATLTSLRERLQELSEALQHEATASSERDGELQQGLLSLTQETLGLKKPISTILKELEGAPRGKGGDATAKGGDDEPKATPPTKKSDQPAKDDPKARKKAAGFIKQLGNGSASDQTRYNAAVQLGDVGHPSAVQPLVQALQKDPYDLVRRAAAFSLGMLGKHSIAAIPVLIEGVGKQEEYVGYMCARALGEISKATLGRTQEFGYDPTMNRKQRRDIMNKWSEWWEKNKALIQPSQSRSTGR